MDKILVIDEQEGGREALLDRQLRALRAFALHPDHPERYDMVLEQVQLIMQPAGPQEKVRDLAEERRCEVEAFFKKSCGFTNIVVPKLALSNTQLNDLRKAGQEPEYRPSDAEVSYDAFMKAVGQGSHWTVTDLDARAKIGWESCAVGYWFIADVQPSCPRTGTSWNDLTETTNLLSLEEYVITWWERKSNGVVLDLLTWSWLRTRWNISGALNVDAYNSVVSVSKSSAAPREVVSRGGGRAAEVVEAAA